MIYRISHHTGYNYDEPVTFTDHRLYLRPREDHHLRVLKFECRTLPQSQSRWIRDAYENLILLIKIPGESRQLALHVEIEVELPPINPYDFLLESYAVTYPFTYSECDQHALLPYRSPVVQQEQSHLLPWMQEVLGTSPEGETVSLLTKLNSAIYQAIHYKVRLEDSIQTVAETLTTRSGCCRDYAFLLMSAARYLGLAARYVSGYCHTGEGGAGRADDAMHAWVEIYLPGAGWKGFDPTNGVLTNESFIPAAVSADPALINPIQGSYCRDHTVANTMHASVRVLKVSD